MIPAGISAKGGINKRDTSGVDEQEFEVLQKYIRKNYKGNRERNIRRED